MAAHAETCIKGVEAARLPGLAPASQRHTGLRACGAARTTTYLTAHDQGATAALGKVVSGTQADHQHPLKQLVRVAEQPFGHGLTGMLFRTGMPQAARVCWCGQRDSVLLTRITRGRWVVGTPTRSGRAQRRPILSLLHHHGGGSMRLLQGAQLSPQMHPAALIYSANSSASALSTACCVCLSMLPKCLIKCVLMMLPIVVNPPHTQPR